MAYTENWLNLEKALGGRVCLGGTPDEIKAMVVALGEQLSAQAPPPSDAVTAEDGTVDGVKYRVYRPRSATGPLPVGIWTHGGGFMTGDLNTDDPFCRLVSEHAPSIIVNVHYSLTPAAKSPTQLQETLTIVNWARENASSIGGDPTKLWCYGGSAGAGLALQVANRLTKNPATRDTIKGVAAIVPFSLHYDHVPEQHKAHYTAYRDNESNVPIIDKTSMQIFYDNFGASKDDPETFVALDTENHKNFPPVYFVSCEKDPLRDDTTVLKGLLDEAGVKTKHDYYEGLPHYFWIFPGLPEGKTYVANLIGGVKWLIEQM